MPHWHCYAFTVLYGHSARMLTFVIVGRRGPSSNMSDRSPPFGSIIVLHSIGSPPSCRTSLPEQASEGYQPKARQRITNARHFCHRSFPLSTRTRRAGVSWDSDEKTQGTYARALAQRTRCSMCELFHRSGSSLPVRFTTPSTDHAQRVRQIYVMYLLAVRNE